MQIRSVYQSNTDFITEFNFKISYQLQLIIRFELNWLKFCGKKAVCTKTHRLIQIALQFDVFGLLIQWL